MNNKDLLAATDAGTLWHYREGSWAKMASPPNPDPTFSAGRPIIDIAASVQGVWILDGKGLHFSGWQEKGPGSIEELIAQLDSADFEKREAATQALIDQGDDVQRELRKALPRYAKSDAKYRIEHILNMTSPNNHQPPTPYVEIGDYRVQNPAFLHVLPDGTTLIGASYVVEKAAAAKSPVQDNSIAQQISRRGVLAISPTGEVKYRGGKEAFDLIQPPDANGYYYQAHSLALFPTNKGNEEWVISRQFRQVASLVDFNTCRVIKQVALPSEYAPLFAVGEDLLICRSAAALVAVRPDAPGLA
jgi:hypothetical protein